MQIDGAGVLVTGGGSGLGAAVARRLAAGGAVVTVFDRDADAARDIAGEVGCRTVIGDVTSESDAQEAVRLAGSDAALRILVNCAGIGTPGKIVGRDGPLPLKVFERVVRVNLVGTFNLMRLAAAAMQDLAVTADGDRGVIVNTASAAAFDGQIGQAAYAASKGGVASLTLPAARELARSGIRVNAIAPGLFATPLLAGLPEEAQASLAEQMPFPKRLGRPEEFANAVLFCVANTYLNAEVIRLDAGLRMQSR